jgi:ABC-type uncharacterized transport system fused permease/ATPase subunit
LVPLSCCQLTDEARRIEIDVAAVLAATRRLVMGLTNLTWVTAGYGWFTLVASILAAAAAYRPEYPKVEGPATNQERSSNRACPA